MKATKITFIFILLVIFTFSNCCKKEMVINKVNPTEYADRMGTLKVQLIDVRTLEEFNEGHIENADNINVLDSTFTKQIASKYSKDSPIYLYCTAGGKRSIDASNMLQEKGFDVVNLDGGLIEWTKAGNKVVK